MIDYYQSNFIDLRVLGKEV